MAVLLEVPPRRRPVADPDRARISGCVITYQEADRIADCVRSLSFCDEVGVVDSGCHVALGPQEVQDLSVGQFQNHARDLPGELWSEALDTW